MTEKQRAELSAKLVLTGTLECRDKDGNLLQTIDVRGAIPLDLTDDEDMKIEAPEPPKK